MLKPIMGLLSIALVFGGCKKEEETDNETISLNLRIHLMTGPAWTHATGVEMTNWVTREDVANTIVPEVNSLWSDAHIQWTVESIVDEPIVQSESYDEAVQFILTTERNDNGEANPERLPYLYSLMQPEHRSTESQLGTNLFHIYLFPFTGNTSQGNAMSGFGFHTLAGVWTNKYADDNVPEKFTLVGDHTNFAKGSLSATISHELGHVLSLSHNQCKKCLMNSDGYGFTEDQITAARTKAKERSQ